MLSNKKEKAIPDCLPPKYGTVNNINQNKNNTGRYTEMHDYVYTAKEEKKIGMDHDNRKRSLSFAAENNLPVINKMALMNKDNANFKNSQLNISDNFQYTQSFENNMCNLEKLFPENFLAFLFGENTLIVRDL
jgi:hypothetical protein